MVQKTNKMVFEVFLIKQEGIASGLVLWCFSDLIKAYSGFIINFESELARRKEPQPSDSEVLGHIIA